MPKAPIRLAAAIVSIALVTAACGGDDTEAASSTTAATTSSASKAPSSSTTEASKSSMATTSKDIVETAVAAGDFKTLATALGAADLLGTLKGPGPFTVFAPTDAAFAKLPAGTLEGLLKDKAALSKILTYHVVSGSVPADKVVTLTSASTVQGSPVTITVKDGVVLLNGNIKVTMTDIKASNGIIHVIDGVLLPS